jgi:peptide/nickel transport system permease protein
MLIYLLRRIALAVPTLLLAAAAVFLLVRLIPGDPAMVLLGDDATAEQLATIHHALGLDQRVPVQFAVWLGRVLHGDLGVSIVNHLPVLALVLQRAAVSATIVGLAVGIATLVALPLGLLAAWREHGWLDLGVVTGSTLLLSLPSFWLGLLLLLFFGLKLGWLPVVGYVALSDNVQQGVLYLILPVVTLAAVECGTLLRMARASAIEVLRLEYVMHARAKGASEARVLFRHVLPNAFAPTLTVIGLILGHLLGGIAVLETVFTLPGLGRLIVDSIFSRDYPVIQGCLLFGAGVYIVINLVVDLCYPLFDPRVSIE